MAMGSPSASQIRTAKINAVGGGRKRCRKGKNCSATCIAANEDCLVELPEPVGVAVGKTKNLLEARQGGGGGTAAPVAAPQATPSGAPSLQDLSKRISQAREEYEDAYGTPNQAAAKAKFDKAIADYEKAKAAGSGAPTAAPVSSTRNLTPDQNERVDTAARMTNYRIEKRLNERQFYDDETNARIRAQNEKVVAPFQKMNENEKAALALYGQDGVKYYSQVNQLLRSGQMEDSTPDKVKMAEFISGNLRSGLEKLPPAEVSELRRAVSGNVVGSLGKLKVGDVIEDKGFGSYTTESKASTLDQFLKQDQPNAIIRVVSPKSARRVAPVMEYNSEDEHIMLPGSKFRLVEVNEKGAYSRKVGYSPMYTFEEVPAARPARAQSATNASSPRAQETKPQTANLSERFAQSKKTLGSGMYGTVKETDKGTVIKKGDLGVNEVDIQRKLADVRGVPKVRAVEYLSEPRNGERRGIIEMDKANGRALIDITSKSDHNVRGEEASKVLDEYLRARRDIHTRGVAHGDMHDANVTWDGKRMGIIDFGNSKASYKDALNEALGVGGVDHAGPLIRSLVSDGASSSRLARLESNLERVRGKANNPNLTEDQAQSLIGEIYDGI